MASQTGNAIQLGRRKKSKLFFKKERKKEKKKRKKGLFYDIKY